MTRLRSFISACAIGIMAISATAAHAATSWLPSYNSKQHIYISDDVTPQVRHEFTSGQLQNDLDSAAKLQNLDVYLVVTRNGTELTDPNNGSGPTLVRRLWDDWTSGGRFPSRRAVVILMTGNADGKLVSVGVRAGESLNSLGIVRDTMNDPNGPVRPVLRTYLDAAPSMVPVKIVQNISAIVASKSASSVPVKSYEAPATTTTAAPKPDSSEGGSSGPLVLLIVLVGIIIAGVFFILRRPRNSSGNDFESRMRSSTSSRGSLSDGPSNTTPSSSSPGSSTARDAAILGAGAVGGYVLGSEVARRREEERRRNDDDDAARRRRNDDSSSSSTYTPPSTPASNCSSSSSSSSCSSSSGGSSCGGGGGSSCGGGS